MVDAASPARKDPRQDEAPRFDAATAVQGPAVAQLRLLVWLSVLLPVLLLVLAGFVSWRERERDLRKSLQHTLDLVHEHAVRTFDTYALVSGQANEIVRGLTDDEVRAQEAAIHERLSRLAESLPQVQDIWLIDAKARPLVTARILPVPPLSFADREYFSVHVAQPRPPYVSEVLRGRVMDVRFFQISWRLRLSDGPFAGVRAVSVQPDYYRDVHGRIARETGLGITLLRDDGAVLVTTPAAAEGPDGSVLRARALAPLARAAPQGVADLDASGQAEVVAWRRIEGYPVHVVAAAPRQAIIEDWVKAMAGYLGLGVPATLGLFFLSLTALRQTQRQSRAYEQLAAESLRRQQAEAALRQVQKMEAVGRLTGGLAHDFNNLLTVVIGNIDMLMRRLGPEDGRARRSAGLAKEGALRAALLTQRLLAFSRQQPLDPKRMHLGDLIAGMSDLIRRTLGEGIVVTAETQPRLWPVHVDPNQFENAILNLAVNARDAMPQGGRLTIRAVNEVLTVPPPHPDDPPPGDWVVIAVADTGVGIPEDIQHKVFEPFFTTKPHGKGTGLGLSQVYGFIKQSGGHVRVESRPGHGTTIHLYLPRADADEVAADGEAPESEGELGGMTEPGRVVLVVEDDPSVRAFTVEALRDLGLEVIEMDDAADALKRLAQTGRIDLLFSDIGLPGMDGRTLARRALGLRPDLRVLLTSGYAHHQIAQETETPEFELLPKPFTAQDLTGRVRRALGQTDPAELPGVRSR